MHPAPSSPPTGCAIASAIEAAIERGETPVTIAIDGNEVTAVGIADPVRPDAVGAITALRALGWQHAFCRVTSRAS